MLSYSLFEMFKGQVKTSGFPNDCSILLVSDTNAHTYITTGTSDDNVSNLRLINLTNV